MSKNQKRIDQLKLELQMLTNELNTVTSKLQDFAIMRDTIKLKVFSCEERIKELERDEEEIKEVEVN